VGEHTQRDGAEGLPPFKLGQMLCVLLSWDDGEITLSEAAYLAGVPYPFVPPKPGHDFVAGARANAFDRKQQWLWTLSDEEANRMALVLLASQEHRGDNSPMNHFTEAVLAGLEIAQQPLQMEAQQLVAERIRLGAIEHGQPAAPKAKAKAQAAKPGTKTAPKPTYRYRNAATGETWSGRGLMPRWLKAALEGGASLSDFDLHAGGGR
jgi:DNA-binding protein H-NS